MSMASETNSNIPPVAGSVAGAEAPLNLNGIPIEPKGDQSLVRESQMPQVLANSSRSSEISNALGLSPLLAKPVGDFFEAIRMGARGLRVKASTGLLNADIASQLNKGKLAGAQLTRMKAEEALAQEKARREALEAIKPVSTNSTPADDLARIIKFSPDQAAKEMAQNMTNPEPESSPAAAKQPKDPAILSYLAKATL